MRGIKKETVIDLQTIYNLADILVDLCEQKNTGYLLKQIQNNAKRIKKITEVYNA